MRIKIAVYDDSTRERLTSDSFQFNERNYEDMLQEVVEYIQKNFEVYEEELV